MAVVYEGSPISSDRLSRGLVEVPCELWLAHSEVAPGSCILAEEVSFPGAEDNTTMPTFAAIDIGSNSCRLKIARVVAHQLKTVAEDREVTRLGASVFESGLVSPDAMATTLRALKRFQRAVQTHGVDQIRVVATAALRDARNGLAFQAWVKAETGWSMEIISGLEEARLIHLGVTTTEPGVGGRVLLMDLGGGSCEITLSEQKRIKETISVPLGAVRLTEQFLSADPAPEDGLARMRQFIARELRRAHRKIQPGKVPLVIATSGTAAALAAASLASQTAGKLAGQKPGKPAKKRVSKTVSRLAATATITPTKDVRKLANKLAKLSLPEREAVPGIGPRRAYSIHPPDTLGRRRLPTPRPQHRNHRAPAIRQENLLPRRDNRGRKRSRLVCSRTPQLCPLSIL